MIPTPNVWVRLLVPSFFKYFCISFPFITLAISFIFISLVNMCFSLYSPLSSLFACQTSYILFTWKFEKMNWKDFLFFPFPIIFRKILLMFHSVYIFLFVLGIYPTTLSVFMFNIYVKTKHLFSNGEFSLAILFLYFLCTSHSMEQWNGSYGNELQCIHKIPPIHNSFWNVKHVYWLTEYIT